MKGNMSKPEKIRVVFFLIIHSVLIYFVLGYTIEVCGVWNYLSYNENGIMVDGEYFPPIFSNAMIFVTNGLVGIASAWLYLTVTVIVSCILVLPFVFVLAKKVSVVSNLELKIVKIILFSWIAVYVAGLIITGGKSMIYSLILMIIPVVVEIVFYFKLKKLRSNL